MASHLSAPEIGVSTIVRGRLLERLSHGAAGQVTIVSGEPASGKTSLLVQWVTEVSPRHRVAWLTVPARTDDEITFWEYLLAAVAAHEVPVDELRAALLDGEPPGAAWLTSLANRLGGRAAPLVVVIDDLHELRAAAALASLAALVEMRPAGVSFVLATRVVPPWPLAGWWVSGRLTEINSGDLRLTLAEARELVESSGIAIGDEEIAQLVERTEGWVGGVQLAVLALGRMSDPAGFLARFAADDELVATYLLRDVLNRQEEDARQFLLDVSVLDVVTAELCDEIRGTTDSAELLEHCRASNLFVSRVGDTGATYRLHALFRELLAAHLAASDGVRHAALHRRASCALERLGEIGRAIDHSVAAGDRDRVAELVIAHAGDIAHQARFEELRRWASTLRGPGTTDPWANLLALAAALCFAGEANETLRLLDDVDAQDLPGPLRELSAQLRGGAHMVRGDVHLLADIGRRLHSNTGASSSEQRAPGIGVAMFMEAVGTFLEGDLDTAAELLDRADRPEHRPTPPAYIAVKSWAALVALRRGDLDHAERCVRASLERREQLGSGDTAAVATAFVTAAELEWERNRLEESAALYHRARRSVPPMPWQAVLVECSRSRLTASLGGLQQALDDLSEVGKLYLSSSGSPVLVALVAERAIDVCLRSNDLDGALVWAHTHETCRVGELPWAIRLRLARAVDPVSSEALISEALDARQTLSCRVDTLLVAADAASSAGRQDVARAHVAEALSLAEPRHMIRRFVDGGPRVAKLVVELSTDPRLAAGPSFSPFFAARVRDAREVATRSRHADGPPVDGLVGQLSVRELDVLGLLAERLSYSEIGDALFVSRNTVKSHVQHIYTKLGVASRAQAVDLGQTLGLISS